MLVYLDICCFNRPFDDQTQLLIRLQTEAKLSIQNAIRGGSLSLAWSVIMDLENAANPDSDRREAIAWWKHLSDTDVDASAEIEARAEQLGLRGLKPMDALHVASAIEAGASWLLTTDTALLKKMQGDRRIRVADPIDFVRTLKESNDEH